MTKLRKVSAKTTVRNQKIEVREENRSRPSLERVPKPEDYRSSLFDINITERSNGSSISRKIEAEFVGLMIGNRRG